MTIKAGFVGAGNFAIQHAEILKELGVNIAACYGTNDEKNQEFSKQFSCKIYEDYSALVSDGLIDILYIVIPPFAHDGSYELAAIKNKIPFLCEKPVGLDLQICNKIASSITASGLMTSSGYQLRYAPLFENIKEILARNSISSVRVCSYAYMPEVHWWRKFSLSGGMMVESGSHYIDLLRYLFGEISTVSAMETHGLAKKHYPDCDIADSIEAILQFESGMIGSIGVTHLLNTIQARSDQLEIYGQDFVMKVDLYRLRYKNEAIAIYKEFTDQDWRQISGSSSKQQLLKAESSSFLEAIQRSDQTLIKSSYPDAVKTLKVALAINQSAAAAKFIAV